MMERLRRRHSYCARKGHLFDSYMAPIVENIEETGGK